jgi:DNA-directed RNA polymerase subunit L
MVYFENIKIEGNMIYFELSNVKLGLANAIRRIVNSEIATYAILRDSIEFMENTSMLNNDIISQRIQLIPLLYHAFDDKDITKITINLNISNENNPTIKNIYSKDIEFKYEDQPIDNKLFLVHDNILLAKLKPNQKIIMTGKINKSIARHINIAYSPISIVSMIYKRDENKILEYKEKLTPEQFTEFLIVEGDRHYLKTPAGEPATYIFNIESLGVIPNKELITMTLDVLYNKLKKLTEMDIVIQTSDRLLNSFDFVLENEDDTLGFPIQLYLLTNPEVDFAGYRIIHPNENTMNITTKLKNNNTLENNKKVFINNIKNIMKIVDNMKSEWSS